MRKLSVRHVFIRKLSRRDKKDESQMIEDMRSCVKKDPVMKEKFKKYDEHHFPNIEDVLKNIKNS